MILHFLKNNIVGIALGVFLMLPFSAYAQAENALGFSVSPVIFDMSANPGQVWKSSIRVINANPYELRLSAKVVGFEPQNESGIPRFTEVKEDDNTSLPGWLDVPEVIVIPPEQTLELPLVIYVPENADPGGHFAAVLIGNETKNEGDGVEASQVATSQVISTLFFLSVAGESNESAMIRSFRTSDYFIKSPEATFELRIENQGNVHLQPTGEIIIFNMWGQSRGKIPINQEEHFGKILPESVRLFSYDWRSDWSIADIGFYRAKAIMSYGTTNRQSLTAETSFLVLPIGWVILTLAFVLLVGYLFMTIIKLYIKRTLTLSGYVTQQDASVSITSRKRQLNIFAPFENGYLDLRESLSSSETITNRIKAILLFAKKYLRFFTLGFVLVISLLLIVWYFKAATIERDYTVITETGTMTSTVDDNESGAETVQKSGVSIVLVNRSGNIATAEALRERLGAAGYRVIEEMQERPESRTVIVFPQNRTQDAIQLSSLLGGAPLSALPEDSVDDEIIVFLGTDQIQSTVE